MSVCGGLAMIEIQRGVFPKIIFNFTRMPSDPSHDHPRMSTAPQFLLNRWAPHADCSIA